MEAGLRVVRGKDWKWGDQDGGEGGVGTVVEVGKGKLRGTVVVMWDNGTKANYNAGRQGINDLRVLDNASVGVRHETVTCDVCKEARIIGTRWKCNVCYDFDLCHSCYLGGKHDLCHAFTRFDVTTSNGATVSPRSSARKVSAKGIYVGSKVVRGRDWNYDNQDGGADKQGAVLSIGGASGGVSWRNYVKVKWDVGYVNDYRRGFEGKIDVQCIRASSGETYYADHLSALGDYGSASVPEGDNAKMVGSQTTPKGVDHPTKRFRKGDVVMIEKNAQRVIGLQQGHGGWNELMQPCLGEAALVIGLEPNGDVKVRVGGRFWILNPECLSPTTKGKSEENEDSSDEDDNNNCASDDDDDNDGETTTTNLGAAFLNHFLEAMLKDAVGQSLGPDSLVKMAAEGKLETVKAIIKNHPGQVDFKVKDMTALQVAAHQGHLQVVIALANAGARLDAQDSNGDNVLHFATIGNQPQVLEVLLKHKPHLANAQNGDKRTCLHLAVIKQHVSCLQMLLKYDAQVNLQDRDGETALHLALERPNVSIQEQLINHPKIDFKLKNNKDFNVIHRSALKNNENALKMLIHKAPTFVNVAKSDGYTALHICTINGYKKAADILISEGKANLNMKTSDGLTPLLLAVNEGRCSTIELLIDKGADVNAQDKDGDTALRLAVERLRSRGPQAGLFGIFNVLLDEKKPRDLGQAPAIAGVLSSLNPGIQQNRAWVAICCYLLKNGADLEKPNFSGKAVGDIISDSLKQLFKGYIKPFRSSFPVQSCQLSKSSVSSPERASCMKCQTARPDTTYYPCGHKVVCYECSRGMKECPKCRQKIQEKVKTSAVSESSPVEKDSSKNNSPSQEKLPRSRTVSDTVKCPLCESNDRNVVFLCGHSCCKECSDPLVDCHVCSETIVRKLSLM